MDPKITKVVQKILADTNKVGEVVRADSEYYFEYNNHAFSILKALPATANNRTGTPPRFYVYPRWEVSYKLSNLVKIAESGQLDSETEMLGFPAETNDEVTLLQSLYDALHKRYVNIDKILDEILEEPPF